MSATRKPKTFAIGDIHGCYKEMMSLMGILPLEPKEDTVVFLGDYVDRGPDSMRVVEQLIDWHEDYPQWVFLYGNHEDIFLDAIINKSEKYGEKCWFANGGRATYKSYGGRLNRTKPESHLGVDPLVPVSRRELDFDWWEAPKVPRIPKSHIKFLKDKTLYLYEDTNYVFVHAGLTPMEPISYSRKYPDTLIWAREEFIESNYDWGKKVIFGHTADYEGKYNTARKRFEPIIMKNKIGIDTAVCPPASKRLTAIELPSEKLYSVPAHANQSDHSKYTITKHKQNLRRREFLGKKKNG